MINDIKIMWWFLSDTTKIMLITITIVIGILILLELLGYFIKNKKK